MPRDNISSQVIAALDALARLKWQYQLLEIAKEQLDDSYTDKNHDRVCLLLEHYQDSYETELAELEGALTYVLLSYSPK